MSSRNIRRLVAEKDKERRRNEEEKENEEPEEEFSPHYVQMNPAYEGLEVSSDSESELSVLSDHLEQPDESELATLSENLEDQAPEQEKLPDLEDSVEQAHSVEQKDSAEQAHSVEQEDSAEQAHSVEQEDSVEQEQPDQYQEEAAAVIPEEDKYGAKKKTYTAAETERNNKKKKRKNKKNKNKKPEDMDEIDWSLREVNRMLGDPPKKVEEEVIDTKAQWEKKIFSIHPNQINVNYELAKVFGEEERLKKARTGTRRMRHEIGLSPDVHPFRVKGLSMTRYKTEGDIKYFKFEHSQDYKMRCHSLVEQLRHMLFGQVRHENNLHSENCVEALLEYERHPALLFDDLPEMPFKNIITNTFMNCDFLYYVEEHKGANQALEQAIYFMQSVGEPSFNFVDRKTRLEYEFVENRPFHIAILKYLHVLTNIACHRTALELAKVLLNLDPTDPLAVIFVIDTLAIRAREHQWLLDLMDHWREKRQAHRLFHMRYSGALAMFHVACKKKDYDGVESAKLALMKAIKLFPPVAVKIMEFSKMNIPGELKNHELFVPPPNIAVSQDLNELMALYAWMIGPRWREPQVWTWFIDTITDLTDMYDRSQELREEVWNNARVRAQLYRRIPTQMMRHLYAIRPMAKYISDGRMPSTNPSVSFNPFPCEGSNIDTYNYFTNWMQQYAPPDNAFMALIQGLYPDMYQIGRRNMGEMLELMDGMEITASHGSFLIVGPNVYRPADDNGLRTYRVVFVCHPNSTAFEVDNQPAPQQEPFLLNGNLHPEADDGIPLLNRLDINDGVPIVEEDVLNGHDDQNGQPDGQNLEGPEDHDQPDH